MKQKWERGAPTTAMGDAGVGMGWSKEGPGSEVHGGCVPSSQPPCPGPSDVEARVSYPLAAFVTHKKRGRLMGGGRPFILSPQGTRCGGVSLIVRTHLGIKRAGAPIGTPAIATTLCRGLITTEYLYVKLSCPLVHTSYSKVQFQHYICTPVS